MVVFSSPRSVFCKHTLVIVNKLAALRLPAPPPPWSSVTVCRDTMLAVLYIMCITKIGICKYYARYIVLWYFYVLQVRHWWKFVHILYRYLCLLLYSP